MFNNKHITLNIHSSGWHTKPSIMSYGISSSTHGLNLPNPTHYAPVPLQSKMTGDFLSVRETAPGNLLLYISVFSSFNHPSRLTFRRNTLFKYCILLSRIRHAFFDSAPHSILNLPHDIELILLLYSFGGLQAF